MLPRELEARRLYRAELAVERGERFVTLLELRAYIDALTSTDWWADNDFPPFVAVIGTLDTVGTAGWHPARGHFVTLPAWAWTELTVCHELAHVTLAPGDAGHGPVFAARYLEIVCAVLGLDAGRRLAGAFRAHGVAVARSRLVPRGLGHVALAAVGRAA